MNKYWKLKTLHVTSLKQWQVEAAIVQPCKSIFWSLETDPQLRVPSPAVPSSKDCHISISVCPQQWLYGMKWAEWHGQWRTVQFCSLTISAAEH